MRRADEGPAVLAAGLAPLLDDAALTPSPRSRAGQAPATDDDHSETAWRMRHARRGILRDTELPTDVLLKTIPTIPGRWRCSSAAR